MESFNEFEIQVIADLWRHYISDYEGLDETVIEECHPEMIGYFQKWLDEKGIAAFKKYLPQDKEALANVVKYCIEHTEQ